MKVCLLARYFDYRGTGVTRISTEVHRRLLENGYEVKTVSDGDSLYSYLRYTLLEIPFRLRGDYDVYHALTTMEGIWLPKDKSIVNFVDLFTITQPERLGAGMGYSNWKKWVGGRYFGFGSRIASRARVLTAISQHVKDEVVEVLGIPGEKIRVIPLGINEDLEPEETPPGGPFKLGTLGQLDRRKRIDLLIKEFRKTKTDAELLIAGKGMDEPILRKLAEGDSRIKFLGFIPDTQLRNFLNGLDVFCFPTWVEGEGLPALEAFACKKPVLVLGDAIIPSEIKSRCIVVESLWPALNNLRYLDNLCQYVDYDSNYAFAKEHSWAKTVKAYEELYKEVAG